MEEFNPFDYSEKKEEPAAETEIEEIVAEQPVVEESAVSETSEIPTEDKPQEFFASQQEGYIPPFVPPYNPINYTAVTPVKDVKPMSRGLKVFTLILVAIIALSTACVSGYFLGKNDVSKNTLNTNVNVGLEAKPKDTDELTPAQVYQKVNPSIVGITVYNSKGIGSNATGVVYSKDGYIITNDHIYSEIGGAKFKIYTHDNKEYDAEFVAGDKVSDLAVLKVKDGELTAAAFGNSDQIIFGENVVAIGRPGGAKNSSSITKGIISAVSRRVQTTSTYSARLIETDSPINPGSSGGALVNMYGQVIGITSSKLASEDIDAVGYAIPTTTMKRIAEELIKNGKVLSRAKLGISYQAVDSITASVNKLKYTGLNVVEVSEDSDLYGKVKAGDIITHINGIQATSDHVVLDIIEKAKAGDKISVTFVNSKNESQTVEAVLKANISESSYSEIEKNPEFNSDSSNGQGGGAFDFPFGE